MASPCSQVQWACHTPHSCERRAAGSRGCSRGALPWGCSGTPPASYHSCGRPGDPCGSSDPSLVCTPQRRSTETQTRFIYLLVNYLTKCYLFINSIIYLFTCLFTSLLTYLF